MTDNLQGLDYNGVPIRSRGDMLCLTDMWKAAGSLKSREPFQWLRSAEATRFVSFIVANLRISQDEAINQIRGGQDPGTWAHWQIGMAYAQYLSAEFHCWCNSVVRARMEGRLVPDQISLQHLTILAQEIGNSIARTVIAEIDPRLSRVEERVDRIDGRLDRALAKRREIKPATRGKIALQTAKLGGLCPCCRQVSVASPNGQVINEAEFDHYYSNQLPDEEHVWLICKPCHSDLSAGRLLRRETDAHFHSFQSQRHRLEQT